MDNNFIPRNKPLNPNAVLKNGYDQYKQNLKLLLTLSTVYIFLESLILYGHSLLAMVGLTFSEGYTSVLSTACSITGFFLLIYIAVLFQIGLLLIAKESDVSETKLISVFRESQKYFWDYFGNAILVGLYLLVPLCLLSYIMRVIEPMTLKIPLAILSLLAVSIIISNISLALVSVVVEPSDKNRIKYSFNLVKGYRVQVFIVLLFSSFIFMLPDYVINLMNAQNLDTTKFMLIFNGFRIVKTILIFPWSSCVALALFNELKLLKMVQNVG